MRQSRHAEGHDRAADGAWPAQAPAPRPRPHHGGELLVKTVLKVTLALCAAWILGGCTALRLAYDNADTYLLYRASSYLDLDGKSSDELDERIDELFAWHRKNALPQYARISQEAAKR